MENLKKIVGENLIELRKSKKLTQFELANLFNYSDKSVSKWENGETLPGLETLNELARFYGVTLDYLTHPVDQNKIYLVQKDSKKEQASHIIVTALIASVIWILATIIFVYTLIRENEGYWLAFVWAIPLTNLVILVGNNKFFKSKVLTLINWTIFIWAILAGAFLQVMLLVNEVIWPLFLIGIPLQISIVLLYIKSTLKT